MPCPATLAEQPQTCPVPESSPEEEELSFEEQSLCVIYEERREDKKVKKIMKESAIKSTEFTKIR